MEYSITTFRNRLLKIGIDVQFIGNVPWIYLDTVNGKKVKGKFEGNHGFTAFWYGVRKTDGDPYKITDITEVFKKIRETLNDVSSTAMGNDMHQEHREL